MGASASSHDCLTFLFSLQQQKQTTKISKRSCYFAFVKTFLFCIRLVFVLYSLAHILNQKPLTYHHFAIPAFSPAFIIASNIPSCQGF